MRTLRHSPHRWSRDRGFTLIELMVTVTIMAILLGVGVPSFNTFVAGQKAKTASSELMTAVMLARSEAIKRNRDVTIAPNTAGSWISGWTTSINAGAITLQQQQALTGVTITSAASNIVFNSAGRLTSTLNFQVEGGSAVKCVKVDLTGIPTVKTPTAPPCT